MPLENAPHEEIDEGLEEVREEELGVLEDARGPEGRHDSCAVAHTQIHALRSVGDIDGPYRWPLSVRHRARGERGFIVPPVQPDCHWLVSHFHERGGALLRVTVPCVSPMYH